MNFSFGRIGGAVIISSLLAWRGRSRNSLSATGAIAAWTVGFISFSCALRSGMAMIAFYYSSSRLTKMQAKLKQRLDAEYKPGGQRNAEQVLSCSLIATGLSVAHWIYVGVDGPIAMSPSLHSMLMTGILGHYACCTADTWASEVGVLNKAWPRLVTKPWQRVPPGTNGGVSGLGLLASVLGGSFIGVVFVFAGTGAGWPVEELWLIPFGGAIGIIGSLLDSLLGALFQATYYDGKAGKVVSSSTQGELICGMDVLNNQQVNMVSVALTTALAMLFPYLM